MTLTATYDGTLSRIRLAATLLGASATYAVFDRTTDALNYTTVRGGEAVTVTSQDANIDDFEFPAGVATTYRVRSYDSSDVLQSTQTDAITQDLTSVWFKGIAKAYLNQATKITQVGRISRANRSGVFEIVGRTSVPVVVSDLRGAKKISLQVNTTTDAERDDFDYLLASGDPVFIHVPSTNNKVQGGYYNIGDYEEILVGIPTDQRFFNLELQEVAAPTAEITPTTISWRGIVNRYPTWADVIAANATWNDVLDLIGEPSDVIIS